MTATLIQRTASAYSYPLLIKNLFLAPVVDNPDEEIVYRDQMRYTYREMRQRVHRLAHALTKLGVKAGDRVVFTSGEHMETHGATNTLRLLQVGDDGTAEGLGEL